MSTIQTQQFKGGRWRDKLIVSVKHTKSSTLCFSRTHLFFAHTSVFPADTSVFLHTHLTIVRCLSLMRDRGGETGKMFELSYSNCCTRYPHDSNVIHVQFVQSWEYNLVFPRFKF